MNLHHSGFPLGRKLRNLKNNRFACVIYYSIPPDYQRTVHCISKLLMPPPDHRTQFAALAQEIPLVHTPGTRAIYSDIGYILLGNIIETITNKRLDHVAKELVFHPLKMDAARFFDLNNKAIPLAHDTSHIAPTEQSAQRFRKPGEVHDDNAYAAGGIAGHAGLFCTAQDLDRFTFAMTQTFAGHSIGGFSPTVVQTFFTPKNNTATTTWRLGWDSPAPKNSQAGDQWQKNSVGHLGFTGCSIWIDLENLSYVILLTNRVHSEAGDLASIRLFRRQIMDTIAQTIYKM